MSMGLSFNINFQSGLKFHSEVVLPDDDALKPTLHQGLVEGFQVCGLLIDAVQYYEDHKDLGVCGCAENLGIGYSTLTKWLKDFRESGDIPVRGSGNYASDEQKEITRLRRELRDAQDALDVLI